VELHPPSLKECSKLLRVLTENLVKTFSKNSSFAENSEDEALAYLEGGSGF